MAVMETGVLLSPFSDRTGLTQPGGGPTELETGSTVPG